MKKRVLALILTGVMAMMMAACGAKDSADNKEETVDLGTPVEVIEAIYEAADLNADLKGQIDNGAFQTAELDENTAGMFLGETAVDYVSGAGSAPLMSSIAYQVVVLQVEDGQDIEATKTELVDNADVRKWVCVEPDTVVAESKGNYILFIMSETATADALIEAFNAL